MPEPGPAASAAAAADALGNHYRRHRAVVGAVGPRLLSLAPPHEFPSLDWAGPVSPFCYEEMALLRSRAASPAEALELLGGYYSLLLLALNRRILEDLERDPPVPGDAAAYRRLLVSAETGFSLLTAALVQSLVDILSADQAWLPGFVICHVGARRDQDDVDVGVVHRPAGDLAALNRLIGRLNREMIRRAVPLHFYLSEHAGSRWFSSTIEEYERMVEAEPANVVVITQLFGAVPLAGEIGLFREFQERVVRRFTCGPRGAGRGYERFVRAVIEEIRSLGEHASPPGEIVPKVDGLRLAKLVIAARRARFGVVGTSFWGALDLVRRRDRRFRGEYAVLEETVAFLETVRFLYQLTFVQEEGVAYGDAANRAALDRVARLMGYGGAAARPSTVLLRDYHAASRRIKEVAALFKEALKKDVRFIRIFRSAGTPAASFLETLERAGTSLPWEEFVHFLEEEPSQGRRFFGELHGLAPAERRRTLERYAAAMERDRGTPVAFLLAWFAAPWRSRMPALDGLLLDLFLRRPLARRASRGRIAARLAEDPALLREWVRRGPPEASVELLRALRRDRGGRAQALFDSAAAAAFQFHFAGPALRRILHRLVERGLVSEAQAADLRLLRQRSKRLFAVTGAAGRGRGRFQALAAYHDLESVRYAFRSVRSGHFLTADYMDVYVRRLLRLALQEQGRGDLLRDPGALALYATGANARSKACENDYDMFVLLDPSRADRRAVEAAVRRVHRELARAGHMPHHRIGERLGAFAVPLEELEAYLDRGDPHDFIERSELLGSRWIAGGAALHRRFVQEVIRDRIFARGPDLARALARELAARRGHAAAHPADLKEGPGGLFDAALLVGMVKALHGVYESRDPATLQALVHADPAGADHYRALFQARGFLTDVRGLLRLTGLGEVLDPDLDLAFPALLKGYVAPAALVRRVAEEMDRVVEAGRRLGRREGLLL